MDIQELKNTWFIDMKAHKYQIKGLIGKRTQIKGLKLEDLLAKGNTQKCTCPEDPKILAYSISLRSKWTEEL